MQISATHDLNGKTVIDGAGDVVGTVEDTTVEGDSWTVVALRLKLLRDTADQVGARHGMFRSAVVDVPIEAVAAVGQAVVLNVSIANLPTGQEPSTSP